MIKTITIYFNDGNKKLSIEDNYEGNYPGAKIDEILNEISTPFPKAVVKSIIFRSEE